MFATEKPELEGFDAALEDVPLELGAVGRFAKSLLNVDC